MIITEDRACVLIFPDQSCPGATRRVAVGIGVAGVDAGTPLRVGLIFGLFEAGMPLLGLLLGHSLARTLGDAVHWIGAALVIATGIYAVVQGHPQPGEQA